MEQKPLIVRALAAMLLVLGTSSAAGAQESVRITLPTAITFTASTNGTVTGTPGPSMVTFDSAVLLLGRALRISVKADSPSFNGPDGASFSSSLVSWTVSNVRGGSASAGTLSATGYTQVFQSNILSVSGGFDVDWTLAAVSGVSRAGTHTVMLRWYIEAVFP